MEVAREPSLLGAGLRTRILSGFAWKTGSEAALQISKIVVAITLARLLTPHEYGVAGMVIVFGTIVPIFSDLALGAALIHRPTLSEDDRSTVFWTNVGTGVVLTCICLLLAAPLASYYHQPEVRPLFMVFSFTFLLGSLGATQLALLTKEMNFRGLETRVIIGTFAGAAVGITVAALGGGPWAIVGQQMTIAVVSTVLLWRFSTWRPQLRFSTASLRSLGSYSGNVFGSHVLIQLSPNVNNMLIGRWVGAAALGTYTLAQNVILLPFYRIAAPIQEVLFPAFSTLQEQPDRIAALWLRVNRLLAAVAMPCLLGLAALAPDFVDVVLGSRWTEATGVIQILCWVGVLQVLQRLNLSILQARDRTRELLWFSAFSLLAGVGAVVAGLNWGVVGVALAFAVASTLTLPIFTWITARAVDSTLWACAKNVAGVAAASAGMAVTLVVARHWLVGLGLSPLLRLLLLIPAGGAIYFGFAWVLAPELRPEIKLVARRLRRSRGQA
jgi:O-antigen/teichoic acid export membrane protein